MLKYHQFRGRLGMGDLHPGGAALSDRLLHWLRQQPVHEVLEIGAGIGNTAMRLQRSGFAVTALEPDSVLFQTLSQRSGICAHRQSVFEHEAPRGYDAVVAESVLCLLDLAQVLARVKGLLRPGGLLLFVDAVWTERVSASQSRQWHDQTRQLFGIACGSRARLTWVDWCAQLQACGFAPLHIERLPRGSAGHPPTANWRASLSAIARDPRLLLWMGRFRLRKRIARMPAGVLESWFYCGRSS